MVAGEDSVILRPKTAVETDPKLVSLLRDGAGATADRAREFFLTLATCNTIVPIANDEMLLEYQGESPDEQALVYAAAAYGFTLVERTSGHIVVDVFGTRQRYVRPARWGHHLQILALLRLAAALFVLLLMGALFRLLCFVGLCFRVDCIAIPLV